MNVNERKSAKTKFQITIATRRSSGFLNNFIQVQVISQLNFIFESDITG
jgi:hypothetical protein